MQTDAQVATKLLPDALISKRFGQALNVGLSGASRQTGLGMGSGARGRACLVGQDGVHHAQLLVEVGRARGRGRVACSMVHAAVAVDEEERLRAARCGRAPTSAACAAGSAPANGPRRAHLEDSMQIAMRMEPVPQRAAYRHRHARAPAPMCCYPGRTLRLCEAGARQPRSAVSPRGWARAHGPP